MMKTTVSPYHQTAANLRENGFHVMPIGPGTKVPGSFENGSWRPMPGWQRYCDAMAADFIHDKWEGWPDAGICVAHGAIVGLDLDTDREDVAEALRKAVDMPNVRRRGAKGWMGYYRPGAGLDSLSARVRWYDKGGGVCVELLLHGTQSVLPPTIHPDTGKPYQWLTPDTLDGTDISELPIITGDDVKALDHEFSKIGLTRSAPRRAGSKEYSRPVASDHDLEKPLGRSVNDRAMDPAAMDQWWPALNLPKSRQRGAGAWEAVAFWRSSNSGRAVHDRNPNLRAVPTGIVDFGADRSYTPIDVVMAARDCSWESAADWLSQYIKPEATDYVADLSGMVSVPDAVDDCASEPEPIRDIWQPVPVFVGIKSFRKTEPVAIPSDAEYQAMIPDDPGDFPIKDFMSNCPGLLGQMADYLDSASATATEAGGLAVALPLLGVIMGKAYETQTGLRTNIYSVALGGSGTGKTSLVNPAKEMMILGKAEAKLGQDRIASGSGLLRMLSGDDPKLCFLDEFGHMLKQINSFGAASHAKQIITEFTALYSAANTVFNGTAYATQDSTAIDCPHLCLFGMATPGQFWEAFGSSSLDDGSVARYLVFPIGDSAPKEPDKRGQAEIAEGVRAVGAAIGQLPGGNVGKAAYCVPSSEAAERARQALIKTMDGCARYAEENFVKGGSAILRRVAENATKIALISAVGRNPSNPEISAHDFDIGHALARWSATMMINNIASHIADNQYEKDVNAVERFIKEGGEGGRTQQQLTRKFRSIRARDLRDIAEGLEREGSIVVDATSPGAQGGRPSKIFRAI